MLLTAAATASSAASPPVSLFPALTDSAAHPRHRFTQTTATTYADLGNVTRFAALRGFTQTANDTIVGYEATLAQYAPLGDVIWPVYRTAFAPNAAEVLAYLADHGMFLTDLWGYVPGSGDDVADDWVQFTPPAAFLDDAQAALGARWLGMDVGEQDGRYIGSYAQEHSPTGAPPAAQRLFFEEHFQRMYSQLGGKVVALQSLTFAHAMAQSGVFTMVGCEAAQGLPSALLFYAVARGAGKQYGLLWFGNVSVYNRFGYKTYSGTRTDGHFGGGSGGGGSAGAGAGASAGSSARTFACHGGQGGPTCGTSLSLFAKLMAAHILYNSGYVSSESSQFAAAGELSPIGELQVGLRAWLAQHGPPGTHLATLALVLDHAAGFTAPRHLYSSDVFRVWGNLPFSVARGDFLVDGVLRLVWPSYQDSSYFHDETGFSPETPFGDTLDVLTSDAPAWLLQRYDALLLASTPRTEPGLQRRKLIAALAAGTNIIAWAGALGALGSGGGSALPPLGGCAVAEAAYAGAWSERCARLPAGTVVSVLQADGATAVNVTEPDAFAACTLAPCSDGAAATPVAWVAATGLPLVWRVSSAAGSAATLTVFASPFGVGAGPPAPAPDPGVDASLGSPYPLVAHVRAALAVALAARAPFSVPGLTWAAARSAGADNADGSHNYTILVSNPTLAELPLAIASNVGELRSVVELENLVAASVYASVGYLPDGYADAALGNTSATSLAGADTRAYRVAVIESAARARVLPPALPPPRPRDFALNVRMLDGLAAGSLPALVTGFPSLQQMFDTLIVDWRYVASREVATLVAEAAALRAIGIAGIVDFDSGINLFPSLRLINNSAPEYAASLAAITGALAKAAAAGWQHAALSLHRTPENNMDPDIAVREMGAALASLAAAAARDGITLHLRSNARSPVGGLNATAAWLAGAGAAGMRVLPNTAAMIARGEGAGDMAAAVRGAAAAGSPIIVGVSCLGRDNAGAAYADSLPLSTCDVPTHAAVSALVAAACSAGDCVGRGSGKPRVLLVADAYVGAEADAGAGAGAALAPGAALDLAYEEAAVIMSAAGAVE